jgi:hypothetical protein
MRQEKAMQLPVTDEQHRVWRCDTCDQDWTTDPAFDTERVSGGAVLRHAGCGGEITEVPHEQLLAECRPDEDERWED